MQAITAIATLLLGIGIILAGNGLLGTLLGVRGEMEGFSSAILGLVMSGYFIGFVLGTFFVPGIIRRVGHIRMFAALASIASVITLMHGLFVHPVLWLLLRLVSGVTIVGLYIVIESWLNEQTPNEQRGHVFSAYITTTLIGMGIGQILLLAGDISSLHLFALGSMLLSLGLVPVALTRVSEPTIKDAHRLGLGDLYAVSPLGVVGCVFAGLGAGAFWGLGAVFAAGIGLPPSGIAGFMGLTILGGIIMMWPVGRLSDRFERRMVLMWVCIFSSLAAALATALTAIEPTWVLFGGLAYGAFGFSIYALSAAHTNDHVEPEQMLEVSSSLQLLWGSGAIAGPIVAGLLMQFTGPESLLPFMAVAALIPGVFARYRMSVSKPVPAEDQGDWVPLMATSPVSLEMLPENEADDEATAESERA
jgi:MFS family permease